MARAILLVMDSVGCGGAPDAEAFGDVGANTLGHIIRACAEGRAEDGRSGPLHAALFRSPGSRGMVPVRHQNMGKRQGNEKSPDLQTGRPAALRKAYMEFARQ